MQGRHPEWANAVAITIVRAKLSAAGMVLTAGEVTEASVVWPGVSAPPRSTDPHWGAIDPRIAYRPANQVSPPLPHTHAWAHTHHAHAHTHTH